MKLALLLRLGAVAAIFGLGLFLLLWTLWPVHAHDWYDGACCSGQDCFPVPFGAVKTTPAGWQIMETGEIIPYGDSRERWSQDSGFHRCVIPTTPYTVRQGTAGRTRCLYVPSGGM